MIRRWWSPRAWLRHWLVRRYLRAYVRALEPSRMDLPPHSCKILKYGKRER